MSSRASRSGGKPFSANRTQIGSASKTTANGQAYPEIKQRGYYSDIIGQDGSDGQLDVCFIYCVNNFCVFVIVKHKARLDFSNNNKRELK